MRWNFAHWLANASRYREAIAHLDSAQRDAVGWFPDEAKAAEQNAMDFAMFDQFEQVSTDWTVFTEYAAIGVITPQDTWAAQLKRCEPRSML